MRTLLFVVLSSLLFSTTGCGETGNKNGKKRISRQELIEINKMLVARDSLVISEYLQSQNLDGFSLTPTGLWIKVVDRGDGDDVKKDDAIEIKYSVSTLDGNVVYSSEQLGTKKFVAGKGTEINGLEEAVMSLGKGGKAIAILPPHLAYGLVGDDNKIPGRTIIRIDFDVVDLVAVK